MEHLQGTLTPLIHAHAGRTQLYSLENKHNDFQAKFPEVPESLSAYHVGR